MNRNRKFNGSPLKEDLNQSERAKDLAAKRKFDFLLNILSEELELLKEEYNSYKELS